MCMDITQEQRRQETNTTSDVYTEFLSKRNNWKIEDHNHGVLILVYGDLKVVLRLDTSYLSNEKCFKC